MHVSCVKEIVDKRRGTQIWKQDLSFACLPLIDCTVRWKNRDPLTSRDDLDKFGSRDDLDRSGRRDIDRNGRENSKRRVMYVFLLKKK